MSLRIVNIILKNTDFAWVYEIIYNVASDKWQVVNLMILGINNLKISTHSFLDLQISVDLWTLEW